MWFEPHRKPDEMIPPIEESHNPYLLRWYIFRKWRVKLLENVYLHNILRSDDDRALHDHPWWNVSIVLSGGYFEHKFYPCCEANKYDPSRKSYKIWRGPGSIVFRRAETAHRLELVSGESAWTIFITGRKSREWGFLCPRGWVHNKTFGSKGCAP